MGKGKSEHGVGIERHHLELYIQSTVKSRENAFVAPTPPTTNQIQSRNLVMRMTFIPIRRWYLKTNHTTVPHYFLILQGPFFCQFGGHIRNAKFKGNSTVTYLTYDRGESFLRYGSAGRPWSADLPYSLTLSVLNSLWYIYRSSNTAPVIARW